MRFALALFALLFVTSAQADARYCGDPLRDKTGRIYRDSQVLREFQRLHPCPSTGKTTGACPGWSKDHVIPLASCGCDTIENLQWLPNSIKSCAGKECKDRWERKIYRCAPQAGR